MARYFHGTIGTNADGIESNGLNSKYKKTNVGGGDDAFASAQGRSYLTSDLGNAVRYAMMKRGNDGYGHVFEFDVDDDENLGIDEDELGSFLYQYLNGNVKKLPFRKNLLDMLTNSEIQGIKKGDFKAYTACKKIIDNLNNNEIVHLRLQKRNDNSVYFKNATTQKTIKPSKHYRFPYPSEKEYADMTDFQKHGNNIMNNMADYFQKNKEDVNEDSVIVLKESQLRKYKDHLDEVKMVIKKSVADANKETPATFMVPNRNLVLNIKKYFDDNFVTQYVDDIDANGYPTQMCTIVMLSPSKNPLRTMNVREFASLADDKFHDVIKDNVERSLFLNQVIKDWIAGSISPDGILSVNTIRKH